MAIILPGGLKINAQEAVDNRILLSAEEMLNVNIANIPKPYFCVCKDDNKVYIYNPDEEDKDCDIGKFRPIERYLFNTETTKDFSDCKIDRNFTVASNVGGYKIGDQISAAQTLKEILYTILSGSAEEKTYIYRGALSEIPTKLADLLALPKEEKTVDEIAGNTFTYHIDCGIVEVCSQYPVIACPVGVKLTEWIGDASISYMSAVQHIVSDNYNIYYKLPEVYDVEDGGEDHKFTFSAE